MKIPDPIIDPATIVAASKPESTEREFTSSAGITAGSTQLTSSNQQPPL
jgi:hypothetical protein